MIVFLTAKTAPATVAAVPRRPVATPLANECFLAMRLSSLYVIICLHYLKKYLE